MSAPVRLGGDGPVSIPVGFFQALQPDRWRHLRNRYQSFNPCRVFSGLATQRDAWGRQRGHSVSIPVGFFQALQR